MTQSHRGQIEKVFGILEEEITLLKELKEPGSDVRTYARGLDRVLLKKIKIITELRERLLNYTGHLETEENMSKLLAHNRELSNQTAIETETDDMPSFILRTSELGPDGNLVDDILKGACEEKDIGALIDTDDDGAAFSNVDLLDD